MKSAMYEYRSNSERSRIHRNANSLLTSTSNKHNKYVVTQKLDHYDDISFRELFGRIRILGIFIL